MRITIPTNTTVIIALQGEGNDVAFWQSVWISDLPFKVIFNGLFQCCSMKTVFVRDMGYWEEGQWNWKLRDSLIDSDISLEPDWSDCCKLLENVSVIPDESDKWRWLLHDSLSFKSLWKTVLPAKVQTLSWRLALDRLPTRSNLLKRRVFDSEQDLDYVFCSSSLEDVSHLFFSCIKSTQVWNSSLSGRCQANRVYSIWFITCWSIWRSRNECIFNNVVTEVDNIVFDIKLYSWNLLILCKKGSKKCCLYG
ncbi:unnamed protein product [Lathyrus sativus]|nr:unnamed protein product [Lathyrus sativus]